MAATCRPLVRACVHSMHAGAVQGRAHARLSTGEWGPGASGERSRSFKTGPKLSGGHTAAGPLSGADADEMPLPFRWRGPMETPARRAHTPIIHRIAARCGALTATKTHQHDPSPCSAAERAVRGLVCSLRGRGGGLRSPRALHASHILLLPRTARSTRIPGSAETPCAHAGAGAAVRLCFTRLDCRVCV